MSRDNKDRQPLLYPKILRGLQVRQLVVNKGGPGNLLFNRNLLRLNNHVL